MKTSIKDIVIGAFAVIGFYVVVTGFNSPQAEPQEQAELQVVSLTPESHKWELVRSEGSSTAIIYNKETGEIVAYNVSNEKILTFKK